MYGALLVNTLLCAFFALLPGVVLAGGVTGSVRVGGGYDSNPSALATGTTEVIGWTQAQVGWRAAKQGGIISVGYTGGAYSFLPESDWSAHRHALDVAYTALKRGDEPTFEAGASIAGTWNHPTYRAYSTHDFAAFASVGGNVGLWPAKARCDYTIQDYPSSSDFDHADLAITVTGRRRWPTRTSLWLTASYTDRSYTTRTLDDVAAGRTNPGSRLGEIDVALSQGLTAITGLRVSGFARQGAGRSRWRSDYWLVLDDPLATSGAGGRAQVSVLGPARLTFRGYVGGQRVSVAYVSADGLDAERTDGQVQGGVIVEGTLPWMPASHSINWSAEFCRTHQSSSDANFSHRRTAAMLSLSYAW